MDMKWFKASSPRTMTTQHQTSIKNAPFNKKEIIIEPVRAYRQDASPAATEAVHLNCPSQVLAEFKNLIQDTSLLACCYKNPYTQVTEQIPHRIEDLTSRHLQILARNERVNTHGIMHTKLYNQLIDSDQIAALRCLVKFTNVAGLVHATHMGGYRADRVEFDVPMKVIVVDQAGLQWQEDFRNTGGLVFYPNSQYNSRNAKDYQLWQQQLYQAIFLQQRPEEPSEYTMQVTWNDVVGNIDLSLVKMILACEFRQALDAVVAQGHELLAPDEKINFKFQRAGMGFFASGLRHCDLARLRVARLEGIQLALEHITTLSKLEQRNTLGKIQRLVLPHSNEEPHSNAVLNRIKMLVEELGLVWGGAPEEDPLRPLEGYVNATTNCGDPHTMIGNEGGHTSVDASLSSNVNLNFHNAHLNPDMQLKTSVLVISDSHPSMSLQKGHRNSP